MKKIFSAILSILTLASLCACNANSQPGNVENVKIDYGVSEKYAKEDMDAAIQPVFDEFHTWNGFELYDITYAGDEECDKDELDYCNSLSSGKNFVECIVFYSSFHTAKNCDNGFNSDEDYTGWSWYLAREADGKWELLEWGY
ncbi:MAG: hypothetical protein IKT61_01390 [Clostridia bacterium]|nr:hypothetical protein [Clostridia bacterium]